MTPKSTKSRTLDEKLDALSVQLRRANQKLDHLVFLFEDGHYRAYYELYGRHFD